MHMNIDNIQDRLIAEFEAFSNKSHRFAYFKKLIQIGQELEPISKEELDSEHEVKASKSNIWIKAQLREGRIYFTADSDNLISKGLVGLLLKVFSGNTPRDIINMNLYCLNEIDLYDRLSEDWLADLHAIILKMKALTAKLRVLEINQLNMASAV